ncbi:CDP-alcohol phosphatidyltransferase family protein [Terrisporobacter hibernicus]|uniref:CDP-alcohol phosphatidyltransferase family protein n=1 Tax=Terrisporobacter hibernicus TaxID=2813371 RepID=UPI0026C6A712
MNLPNKLTLLRVLLIPVFVIIMMLDVTNHYLMACLIFIIASITDALDGHIARKNNLVTFVESSL